MLEVCLLGTGGMMPLPNRWLTSLLIRYNGTSILVDCGEGTQIPLRKYGYSPNPIDVMCITHFHADHISGLPGMLLAMKNAEKETPLLIIGPKGLTAIVKSLRVIAPALPFDVECMEIEGTEETYSFPGFRLEAFKVNHNVPCFGYSMAVDRIGRFDVERAKALGLDIKYWNPLQKGNVITTEDGRKITPDMVLGPPRKGLRVTYATDSRPTASIEEHARGADLFICEGMYGEPGMEKDAIEKKHMTFEEAAGIAKRACPEEMWLTHYSPSFIHPERFVDEARKIFPATVAAKDGRHTDLNFKED